MSKKTLKEKINRVKYFTLLFAVLYFLIGAWLKSDGPNFDLDKAYELIKDTLTITAAFLAPVAAFVLFSDWKDEHRVKSNEKLSREIQDYFFKFIPLVNIYPNNIMSSEEFTQHQRNFFALKFKIKSLLDIVATHDEHSTNYKNNVQQALNKMDTYWIKLVELRHCIKQQEDFINLHNHNIDNGDTLNLLNDNVFKCGKKKVKLQVG